MRVLVTGATGFLGGAVARLLRAHGHEAICTGRDRTKLARLEQDGFSAYALDLENYPAPPPTPDCDAIVHCAARSAPWGTRDAFHRANVDATRTALTLARNAGARRFVHISTPSVYFRFQHQVGVREDAALPPPVNAYAATKRQAEELVVAAPDVDPIILRPRGLYGPGDTTLLPRLIAAARTRPLPLMNDGAAATDLTYVDDVAAAVLAALTAPAAPAQRIFNISGGEALNVREVADRAGKRAGVEVRWRKAPAALVLAFARANELACRLLPGAREPAITAYGAALFAYTQTLDITAARAHLGWAPRVTFGEGLERTFREAP